MTDGGLAMARALTDADDRLVRADEAIAALQRESGGDLPGTVAVPELLETVRKARRYGLKLARPIRACQPEQIVTAWVEVCPREDGEGGCEIVLRHWQVVPLEPAETIEIHDLPADVERDLAELTARLDGEQRLLAVEADTPELQALATAMREGFGKPWTDFVSVEGGNHHQPLHWRLLDGAAVTVPGSSRAWVAHLYPSVVPGASPSGFQLCLTSDEPPSDGADAELAAGISGAMSRMIGRDIAPVLRQPIARIIANAETIRTRLAGPLADEYANYAADIATAGQHLLGLLDDLADLEVVESEEFTAAPDHIDLADVARRAAGILGVRAREQGIEIDAPPLGESLPAVAEFRRALQILLNLVGNAIRYSPASSHVWIRLEDGDGRARVIVADQGPGLDADQQERVFEKFERLGRGNDGGSGLGLYISRKLARAMGGDLTVESAPGQGARFVLDLPGDEPPG